MWRAAFIFGLYFSEGFCRLWPKGVVHFVINSKDYDTHSQDVILSAFSDIGKEICVKFFNTPPGYNASLDSKILYITNPEKRKTCPPAVYNFSGSVVDMPVGYKCLDRKNIARMVMDMLRASIDQSVPSFSSFDLVRKFQEMQEDKTSPYLLSPTDRNYINAHYHSECGTLISHTGLRRASEGHSFQGLSAANEEYYRDKLWPYGVLMYKIDEKLIKTPYAAQLKHAMANIEMATCIVFQEVKPAVRHIKDSEELEELTPRNMIVFTEQGAEAPEFGFKEGKQEVSLNYMLEGAPGHWAHAVCLLLRALGIHMTSSRPDRDNYVRVRWDNVQKGKEYFLEKYPMDAWIRDPRLPYDFDSVTHAPANFMCVDCSRGQATVEPTSDHLWQRVLSMGHRRDLSPSDKILVDILYGDKCRERQSAQKIN